MEAMDGEHCNTSGKHDPYSSFTENKGNGGMNECQLFVLCGGKKKISEPPSIQETKKEELVL
jgi:hypothetical protein